jgi:hypothetical protein
MLFLPVSFMTSYFSVPLGSVQYSVHEFWIAFAAIVSGVLVLPVFVMG